MNAAVLAVVIGGAGCGALVDVARRRIPNAIVAATAAAGLMLAATGVSGVTVPSSLLGFTAGLLLMLPGYVLGGTGAGDVKMFAALGAALGAGRIVEAFLYVLIAGGVLALVHAGMRGRFAATMSRVAQLIGRPASTRAELAAEGGTTSFAYGPAIAVGAVIAVLM